MTLYTAAEVAALLRVKRNTLDKWRLRNRGPRFIRIGSDGPSGRIRYSRAAVEEYLAQAEAKSRA